MKISFNGKISLGISLFSSVALIIIGAMLVKYQIDPEGSLFYLIGIIIGIIGFISLLNYIAGRKKNVPVMDYVLNIGFIIGGGLVAIFSREIQTLGLVTLGAVFVLIAIYDMLAFIKTRNMLILVMGILRLIIGAAFIASGFSEAFTANDEFSNQLWLLTGYTSITFGTIFLVLDTFQQGAP